MVDDIEEELGNIADAAGDIADATSSDIWDESGMSEKSSQTIDFLMDVTLLVTVDDSGPTPIKPGFSVRARKARR
jgi:hypothetical protein